MADHKARAGRRAGAIVALVSALSTFAAAQQSPPNQANPERAALTVSQRDLTPRAAAVRYVREHGLEIPSQDVVVALDTVFQNIDSKVQPFTQAELERDALEIARILGPTARTGAAAAWLRCEKSNCVPSTSTSVLVVNQAEDSGSGGTAVFMRLFAPADCPPDYCAVKSLVVVDVEFRDGSWVGLRNRIGPSKVSVKVSK
jgi:hypothetical protein